MENSLTLSNLCTIWVIPVPDFQRARRHGALVSVPRAMRGMSCFDDAMPGLVKYATLNIE